MTEASAAKWDTIEAAKPWFHRLACRQNQAPSKSAMKMMIIQNAVTLPATTSIWYPENSKSLRMILLEELPK